MHQHDFARRSMSGSAGAKAGSVRRGCRYRSLGLVVFMLSSGFGIPANALAAVPETVISDAREDEHGVLRHTVRSPHQRGETQIAVLLPEPIDEDRRYPVIYLLPVEGQGKHRYGDGIREIVDRGLHRKHNAIFVSPSFTDLPWYADHPGDEHVLQETYLLEDVVPFVEKSYPSIAERRGRLLLGFSKSGWGAWTLLLRHGDTFERAAAWDAPMMMQTVGKYGNLPIFGTQENFQQYRVTDLLEAHQGELRGDPRLLLTGYGSFRRDHQQVHELLTRLEIPHVYRDGPQRKHDWHSGWVAEAIGLLLADE